MIYSNPSFRAVALPVSLSLCALLCSGALAQAQTSRPLERGVVVNLKLSQGISSKGAEEGDSVQLEVAEDVKDALGNVLIAKGTPTSAVVSNAREMSLKNWLTFKRPQLEISSPHTKAVDGTDIDLCFQLAKNKAVMACNLTESSREELVLSNGSSGLVFLQDALKDPAKRNVAQEIINVLATAGPRDQKMATLQKKEIRDFLAGTASHLGLPNTAELFNETNTVMLAKLLDNAGKTPELKNANSQKLTSTEVAALALALAGASWEIYNRVSQWLDDKNIRVVPGTALKAFVLLPPTQPSLLIRSSEYDLALDPIVATSKDEKSTWDYGFFEECQAPVFGKYVSYARRDQIGTTFTISPSTNRTPGVVVNRSDSAIALPGSLTATLNPQQTILHPAKGLNPGGAFYSVVRWAAPMDGVFDVDATFSGADSSPTSTDVYIVAGGAPSFQGKVNGFGVGSSAHNPALRVQLKQGQTVDFVVGPGANNDAQNDATALAAKITRVFK